MEDVTATPAGGRVPGARGGPVRKTSRTIRTRLLRILVLSLAILLALLGTMAGRQISDYRNAKDTAQNARLEITLQGLVHELQKERGLTTGYVGGVRQFRAKLPAQRKATDRARDALDRALAGKDTGAAESVRESLGRLAGLARIRENADDGSGRVKSTFDYFTTTITVLDRLGMGLDDVHDTRLRASYQALQTLGNAKEFTGEERAIVLGSVRAGHFRDDDYSRFMEIRAGRLAALDAFPHTATTAQERRLAAALSTPDAERALSYETVAVRGGGHLTDSGVPPMAWWNSMTSTINGLREVQVSLGADVEERAGQLSGEAQRDLLLFMLLALAATAVLGALALDCVRSVSAPLGSLAEQARDIARERLPAAVARIQAGPGDEPEPPARLAVPEQAGAEVREVAEAFDRVQRAAFDLATEQAVLRRNATDSLVSLGRRNQNLVRRQISFINKLEHEDADPATLANLFELDHLATRMRRNAESLLVLAGESSPRSWSTPQSVTDVLRAALSEVEEYRRVTLRRIEPAQITGSVVAEVAHLLAELVENALSFSPPASEVEIEGRGTSAGYLIAIVDHGLGMAPQALAEANVRLSGTASFMAEPTRFLGHFVVGALARKRGIEVRLGEGPAEGVVARVLIPTSLLTEAGTRQSAAVAAPAAEAAETLPALPAPRAESDAAAAAVESAGSVAVAVAAEHTGQLVSVGAAGAAGGTGEPGEPTPRAAAGQQAGSAASAARGPSAARTRNGLVKRPRRSAIADAVSESDRPSRPALSGPAPDRSPEEVSGMLTSLRSAHMRGGISVEKERDQEKAGRQDRKQRQGSTPAEPEQVEKAEQTDKGAGAGVGKGRDK